MNRFSKDLTTSLGDPAERPRGRVMRARFHVVTVADALEYRENPASLLTKALIETADDMKHAGILNAAGHRKITLRHRRYGRDVHR